MTDTPEVFCRAITLTQPVIDEPVLKSQWLSDAVRAKSLLAQAEQRCEAILAQTQAQIDTAKQQASAEVLQNAQQLLEHWRAEQQQQLNDLLPSISELVLEALTTLLVELPAQSRVETLLKQLLQAKAQVAKATLYCHPEQLAVIEQCLKDYEVTLWQVKPDSAIAAQTLLLSDSQGEYQASLTLSLDGLKQVLTWNQTPQVTT